MAQPQPSALAVVAEALARRRAELEQLAQEAVAEALAARGRDPGLARLIARPTADRSGVQQRPDTEDPHGER